MNYRHAFHAGGFADVIKHIVLVRMLTYLQDKQAAFRVIDTHAGAGVYDLTGEEARRSGEWLTGVARIMQAAVGDRAQERAGQRRWEQQRHGKPAIMASISVAALSGSAWAPAATRVWMPAGPNTEAMRSEAPFMTWA